MVEFRLWVFLTSSSSAPAFTHTHTFFTLQIRSFFHFPNPTSKIHSNQKNLKAGNACLRIFPLSPFWSNCGLGIQRRGWTIEKLIPVDAGLAGTLPAPPASAALDTPTRRDCFLLKMEVRVISVSITLMLIIGFCPERDERSLVGFA